MVCSACNHPNSPTARFCSNCGLQLLLACPVCHQPVSEGQKFCGDCGTRLTPASSASARPTLSEGRHHDPRPERKRVTILFADIVNSTELAESMDAEEVHEIYNGALQRMSQAVTEMGGTIGALMGDGMMAIFGAPIAHEDDPERATLAGLAILEAITHYTPRYGTSLQVRVGINTGLVMMGEMGGYGRTVYTAVGDAVNLAHRLESAAQPNSVLVGESTWKYLAHRFESEPLGTIPVKGLKHPVAVFRILLPKREPASGRGLASEGMRSPLIGRDSEVNALRDQLNRMVAPLSQGGATFVVGEAGIGKSRLVTEISRLAEHSNILWLEGRCLSYTSGQPYAPWSMVLRRWLEIDGESDDTLLFARLRELLFETMGEEGAEHLPFLASLLSLRRTETASLMLLDAEARQVRVRLSVLRWLAKVAEGQPLVLVFEDLHWSDPSSLALLEQAFDLTATLPIRFVIVSRVNDAEEVMALRGRSQARLDGNFSELWLNPLDTVESKSLITALLQWRKPPDELLDKIRSHADGNPFFMEEIIRTLVAEKVLEQKAGSWRLTRPLDTISLPATIEGLLMARIDRLAPAEKELLQRAAVIGRVFWRKLVAEMKSTPVTYNEALYQLSRHDLIRPRGWRDLWETEYIFRHVLTQEAAYRSMPYARRRTYHREVARAMESLLKDETQAYDGVLAHHWETAGDAEMAIRYYEQAARHAAERFANAEAINYYDHALKLIAPGDKHRRFDLLVQQQLLLERLGQRDKRQAILDELLHLAEAWGDGARLARVRAYRYLFEVYRGEGLALPVGLDEEIIAQLQAVGERDLLLELLELLSIRYWWGYSFPFDRAKGLARQQQALAIAEQTGDEYRTFINRSLLADMRGYVQEAEVALQRALQFANQQGDLRKQWTVYHRLGRLLADHDSQRALEDHQHAMTIGRQMADTRLELISADNLGLIASKVGAYERAYHTWQRAYELQALRGQTVGEQAYGLNKVVFALLRSGRIAEARARAIQACTMVSREEDEWVHLQASFLLGEAALLEGDSTTAESLYRSFGDIDNPTMSNVNLGDGFEAYFASDVGQYHAQRGNWEQAAAFLTTATNLFAVQSPHPMRDDDEVALNTVARLLWVQVQRRDTAATAATLAAAERALVAYKGREWSLPFLFAAQSSAYALLGNAAIAEEQLRKARTLIERHAATFSHRGWQKQFMALHATILKSRQAIA